MESRNTSQIGFRLCVVCAAIFFLMLATRQDASCESLFREEFNNLDNWKPLYFPKIPRHTSYTIQSAAGARYLRAESKASASGIVYTQSFSVYSYPKVRWKWKVDNVYKHGDAKKKAGDDYPIRVYVVFEYDPKKAGPLERAKYNSAKALYGEYPPHSTVNYIWANRKHKENILTNKYTKKAKMILLQKGGANVGKWVTEEVNIPRDYRKAFGTRSPARASIAIMNDSDNTGESSISYIDFVEVYK